MKRYAIVRVRVHEIDVVQSCGKMSIFALNRVPPYKAVDEVLQPRVELDNGAQTVKREEVPLD